MNSTRVDCIKK